MFIQVIEGRASDSDGLRKQMVEWEEDLGLSAEGWLGSTGGVSEDGDVIAVVRFETEDAARRNSDRSEQAAWWAETEQLFEGEVTFHDYPLVGLWMNGGSDDAGFVQAIQGTHRGDSSPGEIVAEFDGLSTTRTGVIGATVAWNESGHFTETVYFTSEDAAGEWRRLMAEDEDLSQRLGEWMAEVEGVRFLDLRDPWLSSP